MTTPHKLSRADLLSKMECNTHSLFNVEFLNDLNAAFGTELKPFTYEADGHKNPKGLTLNNGASAAIGIACFDLAAMLCTALGVEYEHMLGRGFQVRACCDAIRKAGKDK
jgi:hypothetical protein